MTGFMLSIEVAKSPAEVFGCLFEVPKWWTTDFEGSCRRLDDEFIICHPGQHYSKQRVVEVIPNERLVWLVTDSTLNWLEGDQHEWTHTKMVFDIIPNGDTTVLQYTHEGLVPEKECYARVKEGWNWVIKERLYNFITVGKTT